MAARPLLVIDDDAAIAGILADTLEEEGYVVDAVTSREEALARLSAPAPAGYGVVISDSFSDPQSESFAWLEQVRALTTAPVVISSAHPERVFGGWRERGFAAFLAKPFDIDVLTALVRAHAGPPPQTH